MFRFKERVKVSAETKDGKKHTISIPVPKQGKRHLELDDIIENFLTEHIRNVIGWCILE